MIIFHGGIEIIKEPNILIASRGLDFGPRILYNNI